MQATIPLLLQDTSKDKNTHTDTVRSKGGEEWWGQSEEGVQQLRGS